MLSNYSVINEKTNEIEMILTTEELALIQKNRTSAPRMNTGHKPKHTKNLFHNMLIEECGNFYFSFYDDLVLIDNIHLFRFLYLSTYSNYKGYLEYGKSTNENRLVRKKDIIEMLGVSESTTYETINYLMGKNLLQIDEYNNVKVNTTMVRRGEVKNNNYKNRKYIRMFDKYVQELYHQCSPREHKNIGAMLKLLPYTHKETNIICKDVNCSIKDIAPLKQKEILEIIGASTTTVRSIMNMKIKEGQENFFLKTTNDFFNNFYIINPRITYQGNGSTDEDRYVFEEYLRLFKEGSEKKQKGKKKTKKVL